MLGDNVVEIGLHATATGISDVEALAAATNRTAVAMAEMSAASTAGAAAAATYNSKLQESTYFQVRNQNAVLQAGREMHILQREIMGLIMPMALATLAMAAMAKGSESAQIGFDNLKGSISRVLGALGTYSAFMVAAVGAAFGGASLKKGGNAWDIAYEQISGAESTQTQIEHYNLLAQTAQIKGDEMTALLNRQLSERTKLQQATDGNDEKYAKLSADLSVKQEAEKNKLIMDQKEQAAKEQQTKQIENLRLESEIAKLYGNDDLALAKQQAAEKLMILKKNGEDVLSVEQQNLMARRNQAEKYVADLAKLGLEPQGAINSELIKGLGTATTSSISTVLDKALTRQPQTGADMLKGFTDSYAKVMADFLANTFMTKLHDLFFGKTDNPVLTEAKLTNTKLDTINDTLNKMKCVCPEGGGGTPGTLTATITPSAPSIWQTLSTITGAVANIAGLGAMASTIGNIASTAGTTAGGGNPNPWDQTGYSASNPPTVTGANGQKLHSGGFVGAFAGGGEVPALVQPGEFIVRRAMAQENKGLLQDINSGRKPVAGGGQNVFFITANDAKSFADMLSSPSARNAIANQVVSEIMANGQLRNAIKNFGS